MRVSRHCGGRSSGSSSRRAGPSTAPRYGSSAADAWVPVDIFSFIHTTKRHVRPRRWGEFGRFDHRKVRQTLWKYKKENITAARAASFYVRPSPHAWSVSGVHASMTAYCVVSGVGLGWSAQNKLLLASTFRSFRNTLTRSQRVFP